MAAGQDGNGRRAASDGGVIDPLLTALTLVYINNPQQLVAGPDYSALEYTGYLMSY